MHFPEYDHCQLCPRLCGVNRNQGQKGFCGETADCRIAAITPHFGEEPCLTGRNGSGTVFFSGCSCGCFFCQNYQISSQHLGEAMDLDRICQAIRDMADQGVHNVNFVTPDHWWPHVRAIAERLRHDGLDLPFVWNSSGYSRPEMLAEQCGLIDIFLPDFKFAIPELARRCMGRADYPEIALRGLETLVDRVGFLRPWDEDGDITASRGVLVRHLVLPGELDNSLELLKLLHDHFGPQLPVSLMSQFLPTDECRRRNDFCRQVTREEYDTVCQAISSYGFRHVFIQPDGGADDFMPDFTRPQPFKGNER